MQVVPYLYFNGNAKAAIAHYQNAFKIPEPHTMYFKEQAWPGMPAEFEEMVIHSELILESGPIYISDSVGEPGITTGSNVQINLNCDTEEELRRIHSILLEGGKENMPLQDTFWGALHGSLTDAFGITWSLNFQKTPRV